MGVANYAFIKDGEVVNIAVFEEPTDAQLLAHFKDEFSLDNIIITTDKAVIDGTYDGTKFWLPQPYPSWIKNEDLNEWVAPVAEPEFDSENPVSYIWNEEILNWEEISE
jgi:hypothetical protein